MTSPVCNHQQEVLLDVLFILPFWHKKYAMSRWHCLREYFYKMSDIWVTRGGMANIGLILNDFKNVNLDNYDKGKICLGRASQITCIFFKEFWPPMALVCIYLTWTTICYKVQTYLPDWVHCKCLPCDYYVTDVF